MDSANLPELADEIVGWLHERLSTSEGQCDAVLHMQAIVVCHMVHSRLAFGIPGESILTGCEN
jgi:hypothetical protein